MLTFIFTKWNILNSFLSDRKNYIPVLFVIYIQGSRNILADFGLKIRYRISSNRYYMKKFNRIDITIELSNNLAYCMLIWNLRLGILIWLTCILLILFLIFEVTNSSCTRSRERHLAKEPTSWQLSIDRLPYRRNVQTDMLRSMSSVNLISLCGGSGVESLGITVHRARLKRIRSFNELEIASQTKFSSVEVSP